MRIVSSGERALVFEENQRQTLTTMETTWSNTMMGSGGSDEQDYFTAVCFTLLTFL